MNRLPTYIIAGAMRSGTTALNSYLRQHPSVSVSSSKEVHYFDSQYEYGLEWYREYFPNSDMAEAVGEATPNYMFSPIALDRIRETLPAVKLIVMLRNPIDRAYSHYWHDRARGKTDADFDETVRRELEDGRDDLTYVARGRYRGQIENILHRFPRESLLVEFFEDMTDDPAGVYRSVCRFIGVDDSFRPETLGAAVNSYAEFRSLAVRRWSRRLPRRFQNVVGRLNNKKVDTYPLMSDTVREILAHEFALANAGLGEIIGAEPPWDLDAT